MTMEIALIHVVPGCVEVAALRFHEVRLEVFDSEGCKARTWKWRTNGDIRQAALWKP